MKITTNAQHVRAAMAHISNDKTREVLNGVLFAANGDIVGTDGRSMFLAKGSIEEKDRPSADIIIKLDGAIPIRTDFVEIDTEKGIAVCYKIGQLDDIKKITFSAVDGNYPNYTQIIPGDTIADVYSDVVCLSASQLLKLTKTFGKDSSLRFRSTGVNAPLVITCDDIKNSYQDCLVVQMPIWPKEKKDQGVKLYPTVKVAKAS